MRPLRTALSVVIMAAIVSLETAGAESRFVTVTLPYGVSFEAPKGWWALSDIANELIQTSVEAAIDVSDINLQPDPSEQEVNLIAINSMPRTTYAAVRIDRLLPPASTPQEVTALTPQDLENESAWVAMQLRKVIATQGNTLLKWRGVSKDLVGGHQSISYRYQRSGPKGPVNVEILSIYTPTQELRVNLSYRESERVIWMPVIEKIRRSIKVTQ